MKKSILLFCFFTVFAFFTRSSAIHSFSQEVKTEQQNGVTIISNPKIPQPENGIPIRIVFREEFSILNFNSSGNSTKRHVNSNLPQKEGQDLEHNFSQIC